MENKQDLSGQENQTESQDQQNSESQQSLQIDDEVLLLLPTNIEQIISNIKSHMPNWKMDEKFKMNEPSISEQENKEIDETIKLINGVITASNGKLNRFIENMKMLQKENNLKYKTYVDTLENKQTKLYGLGVYIDEGFLNQFDDKGIEHQNNNSQDYKDIQLNPLEVILLLKSLRYLIFSQSKMVMVGIFQRDEKGLIVMKGIQPKMHKVLLFKNSKKEFVLIDPTNSEISSHIANEHNLRILHFALGVDIKILALKGQKKIYSPYSFSTGRSNNQYRDDHDVCTKICFGLDSNGIDRIEDPEEILKIREIKEIANNPEIIPELFFPSNTILKIRQSSSNFIRSQMYDIQLMIKQQLDIAEQLFDQENYQEIHSLYEKIFQKLDLTQDFYEMKDSVKELYLIAHEKINSKIKNYDHDQIKNEKINFQQLQQNTIDQREKFISMINKEEEEESQ